MAGSPLVALMDQYDRRFPDATTFARGAYLFEARKIINDLADTGWPGFAEENKRDG